MPPPLPLTPAAVGLTTNLPPSSYTDLRTDMNEMDWDYINTHRTFQGKDTVPPPGYGEYQFHETTRGNPSFLWWRHHGVIHWGFVTNSP
jgi:hypothetical protein